MPSACLHCQVQRVAVVVRRRRDERVQCLPAPRRAPYSAELSQGGALVTRGGNSVLQELAEGTSGEWSGGGHGDALVQFCCWTAAWYRVVDGLVAILVRFTTPRTAGATRRNTHAGHELLGAVGVCQVLLMLHISGLV